MTRFGRNLAYGVVIGNKGKDYDMLEGNPSLPCLLTSSKFRV